MKERCLICEAIERMEREWIERNGRAESEDQKPRRIINTCKCGGVNRFIVYGASPTTEEEERQLFRVLIEEFGLSKKTGPGVLRFIETSNALDKHETLASFAEELGVSIRKAQELAKWVTGGKTFRQYRTEKARREPSRKYSRLRFPRSRRRR